MVLVPDSEEDLQVKTFVSPDQYTPEVKFYLFQVIVF